MERMKLLFIKKTTVDDLGRRLYLGVHLGYSNLEMPMRHAFEDAEWKFEVESWRLNMGSSA